MRSIRYGLLAVAGCGVLLLCVAILVVFGVQRTSDLAVQQERVGIQLFGVREVFEALLVMESSQRGYLLTRDPAYLEPYRQEEPGFNASVAKLEGLFRGDAAAERIVGEIRDLARAKRDELVQTVKLAETGDFDGAIAIVTNGAGKHEMELFRLKLFSLIAERRAARTRFIEQGRDIFHQLYFLGAGAALLVLLMVAVAVRALSTSIARLDAAQKAEERNAMHDALTGLPNRRYLSEWLATAMAGSGRSARQLCVLYCDLDGFKAVNDRFGHEAGDRVLEAAALRLRATLRASDFVARLGGDEFVAVLPDTKEPPGVEALIKRLEEAFRPPLIPELCEGEASASIGKAVYPQDGSTVDALLMAADRAMYVVKQGRYARREVHSSVSLPGIVSPPLRPIADAAI
jgi:diguanylate cyclase (GGDEF)-like protein